MRFLSVCSGIEAASAAWSPLGWRAVAFSEIEPFPCAVLAHHYPDTPNWGDMTQYKEWPDVSIDLLCGGTPCQSFSVAGLRKGLDDPRGNLMLTYGAIAAKYRPKWLVWENVPGVLSSNGGMDFGTFLGMLGQLGYGFAYRVLDAQYFGVAQRRRRVFVVGCLGDWRSAAAVLFERHSLQGHSAPSREARKVAPTIPSRSTAGGGLGTDFDCDGGLQVAGTMKACKDSGGWSNSADHAAAGYMIPVETLCVATGQVGAEIGAEIGADMAPTLNCNHEAPYVAKPVGVTIHGTDKSVRVASSMGISEERTDCLRAFEKAPFAVQPSAGMQVRRLTPEECEALQGFPREFTKIPWRKKPASECPDGPRYKALGNSWAVPNARWIGERISAVELLTPLELT